MAEFNSNIIDRIGHRSLWVDVGLRSDRRGTEEFFALP